MPQNLPDFIAKKFAEYERRIKNLERTPRLTNASIDDGAMAVKDEDGLIKTIIGRQPDGSHGVLPRNSGPQPTPSAPILPAGTTADPVRSSFPVEWDGQADGPVPEVYGHLEVWGQRLVGEDLEDVSLAKLMGTIRDRTGGATTVAAGAPGVWVFWFRMAGPDRVTKGEFSESSTVTVTALVDAQDIEDRLNAFAEGELPDGAYENLLVRLGEFMNIRADQIDVNSLAADSAFIALLETAGIILRDEGSGRRTEVSGQGLSIIDDATDLPILQLGLYGDDFVSLTNEDGDQSVILQRSGLIAGEVLSAEEDFMVMGKPLLGSARSTPGMAEMNAVLDGYPRGIIAQLRRVFTEASTTASEVTIAYMQARLEGGRIYRLRIPPFALGSTGSDADFIVYQRQDTAGWPGMPSSDTSNSVNLGQQPARTAAGEFPLLSYDRVVRPEEDGFYRWVFVIRRKSGTSISFLNFSRGTAHIFLEDIGRDVNNTGKFLFQPASTTTDVGTAESTRLAVSPSAGLTYSSTNASSATFGVAATGDPRYRTGYWDIAAITNTNYITACKFPDSSTAIGGRQIISAAFRVQIDAWVNPTIADTIRPGFRVSSSSLPSSLTVSSVEWLGNIAGVRAKRWVTIPIPQDRIQEAVDGTLQLVLGEPSTWRTTGAAVATNQVELELRLSTE